MGLKLNDFENFYPTMYTVKLRMNSTIRHVSHSSMASKGGKEDNVLRVLVSSATELIGQFEAALSGQYSQESSLDPASSPRDPLELLSKSATVIKAHTTKLALLITNKPFTPSAIASVIRELSSGPLPALMTGVELCYEAEWGSTFRHEVKSLVKTLLQELRALLHDIPLEGQAPFTAGDENKITSKDSLASTGVVWEACEALIQLKAQGIAGVMVRKAQMYHDMLQDAIAELQEWSTDAEDDDDDRAELESDQQRSEGGLVDEFDDLFQASNRLPKDHPELREQLDDSLKKLNLIRMLYKAIIKRRLQTYPPHKSGGLQDNETMPIMLRLEFLMKNLKAIPEETDELANAFYDLDADQAGNHLCHCLEMAKQAAEIAKLNWNESADEFGTWVDRWMDLINKK